MWPFKRKSKNLEDSGLYMGMVDWHSHILPGVDDGIKTLDDSLSVLRQYEKLGVKKVWLTPHIMEDYPNTTQHLRDKFEQLSEAWDGDVEIKLASENMLDNLFEERLEKHDFLPIGDEGRHLLVETSYYTPPMEMDTLLKRITSAGYFTVLAHPERYRYMNKDDYKRLKDLGILFQSNYMSLVGGYGETTRKKAEWLLKNGMVDMIGSDLHRLEVLLKSQEMITDKIDLLMKLRDISSI